MKIVIKYYLKLLSLYSKSIIWIHICYRFTQVAYTYTFNEKEHVILTLLFCRLNTLYIVYQEKVKEIVKIKTNKTSTKIEEIILAHEENIISIKWRGYVLGQHVNLANCLLPRWSTTHQPFLFFLQNPSLMIGCSSYGGMDVHTVFEV